MSSIDDFLDDDASDDEQPIHPLIVVNRDDIDQQQHDGVVQNALEDYAFVRRNLKQIIETNVKALEGLAKVATSSESPRAYEVLSSFMKQMSDANEALMKLHKDAKDITSTPGKGDDSPTEGGGNTINNTFVGTTEELLELLEGQAKAAQRVTVDNNPGDDA